MSLYNIYLKITEDTSQIEDVVCLGEGFCLMAFLFGPFWFLYHKMFREFSVLIIASLFLTNLASKNLLGSTDCFILHFGFVVLVALNANFWRELHLKKNNYSFSSAIIHDNSDLALAKFISHFITDNNCGFEGFSDIITSPKLRLKKSFSNLSRIKYKLISIFKCR